MIKGNGCPVNHFSYHIASFVDYHSAFIGHKTNEFPSRAVQDGLAHCLGFFSGRFKCVGNARRETIEKTTRAFTAVCSNDQLERKQQHH
ncbi:MAG: hypothetical protein J5833_04545 [Victivallales bacterium]|nr:hypothetical protein [Victivallales bacterium]